MFNLNIYHDLGKVFFSAKVLFKYLIIERVVYMDFTQGCMHMTELQCTHFFDNLQSDRQPMELQPSFQDGSKKSGNKWVLNSLFFKHIF